MTFFTDTTLEQLRSSMSSFVAEREWQKFHTPRNVLLALVGEVGELAELFQWKGEVIQSDITKWEEKDSENLRHELADVQLYLVRLADLCGVDLGKAALEKMEHNAKKYPADKCKGSAAKYTAYQTAAASATTTTINKTTTSSSSSSAATSGPSGTTGSSSATMPGVGAQVQSNIVVLSVVGVSLVALGAGIGILLGGVRR